MGGSGIGVSSEPRQYISSVAALSVAHRYLNCVGDIISVAALSVAEACREAVDGSVRGADWVQPSSTSSVVAETPTKYL